MISNWRVAIVIRPRDFECMERRKALRRFAPAARNACAGSWKWYVTAGWIWCRSFRLERIVEAYNLFGNRLDGVIKMAIRP